LNTFRTVFYLGLLAHQFAEPSISLFLKPVNSTLILDVSV
jgi:hypothetical protein